MMDQFGRTITSHDNGNGTTTYSAAGLSISFPTGTPDQTVVDSFDGMMPDVASLASEIQDKIYRFNNAFEEFLDEKYSAKDLLNFLQIHYLANLTGKTNRAAYILPIMTWGESLITFAAIFIGSVLAQTDAATVSAMTWNFSSLDLSDPKITIIGAISIPN